MIKSSVSAATDFPKNTLNAYGKDTLRLSKTVKRQRKLEEFC